ncbi:hypothetical protein YB2330_001483 [Saitoella coloradoensis]
MSVVKLQDSLVLAQLVGVIGSALFAVGNFATSFTGVMPVLAESSTTELPLKYQLIIWRHFVKRGKALFAPTAALSSAAYGLSAYLNTAFRNSALASMCLCLASLPFTLIVIAPSYQRLFTFEDRARAGETSETFEKNVLSELKSWNRLNIIRFSLVGIAFLNGLKDLALM